MAVRSINVSDDVWEKAKNSRINISAFVERELQNKITGKKEIPERQLKGECNQCKKICDDGYICDEYGFFCNDCEDSWPTAKRCNHEFKEANGNRIHYHVRIGSLRSTPGINKTLKDIEKGNRKGHKNVNEDTAMQGETIALKKSPLNSAPF